MLFLGSQLQEEINICYIKNDSKDNGTYLFKYNFQISTVFSAYEIFM